MAMAAAHHLLLSASSSSLFVHPFPFRLSLPSAPPASHPPKTSFNPIISALEYGERPPTGREEAILQARASLVAILEKGVKGLEPSTIKRRKQRRQLRLQLEIPVLDDSLASLASLVTDLVGRFSVGKKGSPVLFAVCTDNGPLVDELRRIASSVNSFDSTTFYTDFKEEIPEDTRAILVVAPKLSSLASIERIAKNSGYRPVVLLNPDWLLEELEEDLSGSEFLKSFEVVYSFTPLAIRSFFRKTEGAVLKYVKSGAPAGRRWHIFVKEGDQMRCVSSQMHRPSAVELENALYNSVAANSPITKSVKFLRQLVSGR